MKNTIKNVILVCAMGSIAIMSVGIYLYDYIPSGLTVSKASQYETAASTTETLSAAQEAQSLLTTQTSSTSSTSASKPTVKTNIVLKEYNVSKTDLAIYQQSGSYVQGRADPFAEVTADNSNDGSQAGSTTTTTTNNTTVSDGTYYNSSKVK